VRVKFVSLGKPKVGSAGDVGHRFFSSGGVSSQPVV
jgi:hypothetical protein